MSRIVKLLLLPAAVGLVWWMGTFHDSPSATVDLVTTKVTALRGTVINRMQQLGAIRTAEQSHFGDDGTSELRFRIPTARVEEAIVTLDQLGGRVTDQDVELASAVDDATTLDDRLGTLGDCLDNVERAATGGTGGIATKAAGCRQTLTAITDTTAATASSSTELAVRIHPERSVNPFMVAGALVMLAATVAMGVIVLRSTRTRRNIDLRDDAELFDLDDEIYLRRN